MKRSLLLFSMLFVLSILCSCSPPSSDDSFMSTTISHAISGNNSDFYFRLGIPESVDEMPEKSVFIVKGKFLDDAEGTITYVDEILPLGRGATPENRSVIEATTITTLEITEVIQGDLQVGDKIKVAEPYYVDNQDSVKTVTMTPGYSELYAPSEPGKEYLFFFDYPFDHGEEAGIYLPLWNEFGRYPVPSSNIRSISTIDSMTNEELNLGEGDASAYKDIYQQVVKKFMW